LVPDRLFSGVVKTPAGKQDRTARARFRFDPP
jgi:hypothetical protein